MSDYKKNPYLKQLITEIADKSSTGRISLDWKSLYEARNKKLKQEATNDQPKKNPDDTEDTADSPVPPEAGTDAGGAPAQEEPAAGGTPPVGAKPSAKPAGNGSAFGAGADTKEPAQAPQEAPAAPDQEANQAEEDALKAKAQAEKAKAEKGQAEKEIKDNSYVHLTSAAGVSFLLAKLIDHAFKTNTIDALAGEMVQKLKIQTPEEFQLFSDEMVPYKNLPGVGDLLISMKGMANAKPDQPATPESGA